ncbi:MAG TPA: PAS domain S-box protein [Methanobacteriaceae archaeon]|jgi:two-component system, NarL family, sensor histidine kinase UhpB|nr:PAS domain S-box protein [Methanobacteriaceae archaeon]
MLINVFLIEDNPGDAYIIKEMLKEIETTQFNLITADSLEKGLNGLKNSKFDILLLDLSLPDSYGIETFNEIYQKMPRLPIIILSGLSDEQLALNAVAKGAQDYLVKGSVDSNLLVRSIKYAIERKQLECKLKDSEEKYRIMVEKTKSGLFLIDINNKLSYVNKHMADMLGYGPKEMIGKPVNLFMDPSSLKNFKKRINKSEKNKNHLSEIKFIHKNGSYIWAITTTGAIHDYFGKYRGSVSIMTDISARKGLEKSMMQALMDKDENFRVIMNNMLEAMKPLIDQGYMEGQYQTKLA